MAIKCDLLTRREFLKAMVSATAVTFMSGRVSIASLPEHADVNVLFIMTDQHHHKALGIAGNELIKTPNLDRLAREGALFTNSFCVTPFCSPTRASLVTGLYPHAHGINANVDTPTGGLDSEFPITENLLHDAGFTTHHRGKWHLGAKRRYRAYAKDDVPRYGAYLRGVFNQLSLPKPPPDAPLVYGRPVQMIPAVQRAHAQWLKLPRRPKQDIALIGKIDLPPEHLPESWLTDLTIELMRKNVQRNFMLTCSYSAPHAFWVAPEPYYSMYDRNKVPIPPSYNQCPQLYESSIARRLGKLLGIDGMREYIAIYYGMVSMVDWNVGRLLQAMRELGIEDKTLVIFTSDHGDMQGAHGMTGKSAPACYEEIIRVPLIIRYPKRIPAGTVVDTFVSSVDIMPTILDYVGLPIPNGIHGCSLRPFIEGQVDGDRDAFVERTGKRWFQRMIRTRRWKYVYRSTGLHELFNLVEDPYEMHNLISEPKYRTIVKQLHARLRDWMATTDDPAVDNMPRAPA